MRLNIHCEECGGELEAKWADTCDEGVGAIYVTPCIFCRERWEKDIRVDERESMRDSYDESYRHRSFGLDSMQPY